MSAQEESLTNRIRALEAHVAAYEQLLDVQEQAVQEQTDKLVKERVRLKGLNEQLEQREETLMSVLEELRAFHSQLQETQAQLIQAGKLAAIGRIASGIAHEVKNPLGIILQGIGFLETTPNASREQMTEVCTLMKVAILRADSVVHGLLTLAKPAPMKPMPGNINEPIEAILALLGKQATLGNVTIAKELSEKLPPVLMDSNQIEQVLMNIFMNSLSAMQGGGRLTFRTGLGQVTSVWNGLRRIKADTLAPGSRVVVCEIQDTGAGISEKNLDKVFEPFFTTKQAGVGTGLGMAIVRTIILNHGGAIEIDSTEGKGTVVRMLFPFAVPNQA